MNDLSKPRGKWIGFDIILDRNTIKEDKERKISQEIL